MSESELVEFLNTNRDSKVWIKDSVLYFDRSKMKPDTIRRTDFLPRYSKDQDGKLVKLDHLLSTETTRDEVILENDSVILIRRYKIVNTDKILTSEAFRRDTMRVDLRKKVTILSNVYAQNGNFKRLQIRPTEDGQGQIYTLIFENPDSKKLAAAIFTMKRYLHPKRKK